MTLTPLSETKSIPMYFIWEFPPPPPLWVSTLKRKTLLGKIACTGLNYELQIN